jgi:cobalt-zinc-cadmium efflux system outer membrane protein
MLLMDYIKHLTMVMLTVILMGCASYQPKPIVSSDAMAAFEARTFDSPSLKNFIQKNSEDKTRIWPLTAWDLNLLTLAALYYSPDLDVARAQWGVVKAGGATAEMIPNPGLGLVTQPANTVSGISSWPLGWNLDIPIEIAGKRGYRIKQSKQFSQAALFNLYGSAWRVRSRLKAALIELYQAQENGTWLKKQEASRSEMATLLERRFAEGAISFPETTQARITLAQSRLALQEAQKRQELALAQLAAAIGLPASSLKGVNLSFTGLTDVPRQENLPSSEARRQALLNRTDIRAALAEYEASQTALQLEIAKQYPDIHLGPAYLWDQGVRKWQVGVSFSLPIFNRNEGPIAEAEARREEAAAKFDALQARAINEVDSAWVSYQASTQQLTMADVLLQAQQKHQRSIVAEFNIGESDRLALSGGQLELIIAEQARLDAQVKVMQSLGLLEDAIQRPLAPEVFQPIITETNPRKEKKSP